MSELSALEAFKLASSIKTKDDMKEHFGKVFMGGSYLGGSEPNTPLENYFEKELIKWVNSGQFNSVGPTTLKLFQKFDHVYPAKLVNKAPKIYRGLAITKNSFPMNSDYIIKFITTNGWNKEGSFYVKNGSYTPGSKVESWTDQESSALQFARYMHRYNPSKLNSLIEGEIRSISGGILGNHHKIMKQPMIKDSEADFKEEYKKNPQAVRRKLLEALFHSNTFKISGLATSLIPMIIEMNNKPNDFVFNSHLMNLYSNKIYDAKENEVVRLSPSTSAVSVKWKIPSPIYEYITVNDSIWSKIKK